MKVLLVPMGTSGDVFPLVAIGKALRKIGHDPVLISLEFFREAAREAGLPFRGVLQGLASRDPSELKAAWRRWRGVDFSLRKIFLPAMPEVFDAVQREAVTGAVIVATTLAFGARAAGEKLGIPVATVHLQPYFFFSAAEPGCSPFLNIPSWVPYSVRQSVWRGLYGAFEAVHLAEIRRFRRRLGLPETGRLLTEWVHSPQLVLGLFPEWFGGRAADWPSNTRLTGFVRYDRSDVVGLPDAAERFLEEGRPPVVFTPGTAMVEARRFIEAFVEACLGSGERGIVLSSYRGHMPQSLPREIASFDYIPLSLLLPRASALVHHGGIGTLAQAIAARTPQLVVPFHFDQPDNARRVERLGIGESIAPARLSSLTLARALRRLLRSETVADRCAAWAQRADFAGSLEKACRAILGLAASDEKIVFARHP